MRSVQVHLLPQLVDPAMLKNSNCVVIDVLRATTTIVQALASGAKEVIPCLEVSDALAVAEKLPEGSFVLGGERHAERIAGFHLGNSPAEYTPETVAGKTVIITTTNGTRAMHHCHAAYSVLLASFTNRTAVELMLAREYDVHILCAGTDGQISLDDVLLAGSLAAPLSNHDDCTINDSAELAISAWREAKALIERSGLEQLVGHLAATLGGRNLFLKGMQRDIQLAAEIDLHAIVPCFANGRITPLSAIA